MKLLAEVKHCLSNKVFFDQWIKLNETIMVKSLLSNKFYLISSCHTLITSCKLLLSCLDNGIILIAIFSNFDYYFYAWCSSQDLPVVKKKKKNEGGVVFFSSKSNCPLNNESTEMETNFTKSRCALINNYETSLDRFRSDGSNGEGPCEGGQSRRRQAVIKSREIEREGSVRTPVT